MPAGRPTKYDPAYCEQARKLCQLGATDYEMAQFFAVDVATIYRWRNEHAEFCEAVKVGKEHADARVARSLYNRAVGYTFESEKIFHFQGQITRAPCVEHVPPDPGAGFNWLKNRDPERWRDRQQHELTGANGGPIVAEISARELIERRLVDMSRGEDDEAS